MATDNKETPEKRVSYKIDGINDVEFHIYNLADYGITNGLDKTKIFITYNWMINVYKQDKKLGVFLSIYYIYKIDENNSVPLVNYFNETKFLIDNFDETITVIDDTQFNVPDEAMETFLSIGISTARGILIEKLSKSPYSNIIIPAAQPDFIKKMVKGGPVNKPKVESNMKAIHRVVDAETRIPVEIEGKENKFDSYEKADECREELQKNGNNQNLDISTDILV